MRRFWWLLLLLSVGLNIGLVWATIGRDEAAKAEPFPALADPEPLPADSAGLHGRAGRHCRAVAERLGLAPACADSLGEVHCRWLPRIRSGRLAVAQQRLALAEACGEPELSAPLVMERQAALSAAQARLDSVVMVAILGELRLLDPSQRVEYLRLMAWERRVGEHPGPPHGPRPGSGGGGPRGGSGSSPLGAPAP